MKNINNQKQTETCKILVTAAPLEVQSYKLIRFGKYLIPAINKLNVFRQQKTSNKHIW